MEKPTPIKAIVFDYGGVIKLSDGSNLLEKIATTINVPAADFVAEYFKHNHLGNVENPSSEMVISKVVSFFDTKAETRDKALSVMKDHQSHQKINTELVSLFPKLRARGFSVAIFSNNTSKLRRILEENGILELVDKVVVSGEIGFQKPHKEAFDVLFEILGVMPNEVIFIDDTPRSLEKADEIGYIPILYKDNETLKHDLKNLGILFN